MIDTDLHSDISTDEWQIYILISQTVDRFHFIFNHNNMEKNLHPDSCVK